MRDYFALMREQFYQFGIGACVIIWINGLAYYVGFETTNYSLTCLFHFAWSYIFLVPFVRLMMLKYNQVSLWEFCDLSH